MMTMQELATAFHYDIPIIAIVVNNNKYGTIRAHQEKHFPNRIVGTELSNPDFSKLADIFDCHGETVSKNDEFIPALQRALHSKKPSLIEVRSNPDILSVNQAITEMTNA